MITFKHNNQMVPELLPEHIESMPKSCVFASGETNNRFLSSKRIRWCAIRSTSCEWSIYYSDDRKMSHMKMRTNGHRVASKTNVNRLVNCHLDAFKYYKGIIQ